MLDFKKNILFYFLCIGLIALMCYSFLMEKNNLITPFIYVCTVFLFIPFLSSKIERTLDVIILLAPISIPYTLPLISTKISAPSELLTGFVILAFGVKTIMGLPFRKDILKHPITLILITDLVWTLITTLTSNDMEVSLKRFILKFAFVFVYYYLFSNYYDKPHKRNKIYFFYSIGLIIPIVLAFNDSIKYGFGQASSFVIGQPFFADHTIYGACLAFILPYLVINVSKKNRQLLPYHFITPILLFLVVLAEIQSYSRASWISIIACLTFYLLTKLKIKGYQMAIGFAIVTIGIVLNFDSIYQSLRNSEAKYDDNVGAHLTSVTNLQNDASNLERINRWVCAYRMFEEKPLVGFGPGTYQFEYDKFQTPEFMTRISTHRGNRGNAHSEYLTYLSENGLPGLLIFIALIAYSIHLALKLIYKNLKRETKNLVYASILGLITFFTHGLFNTFSDYEKMSILIYGSLSILVTIDLAQKNQHEKDSIKI